MALATAASGGMIGVSRINECNAFATPEGHGVGLATSTITVSIIGKSKLVGMR